MPYKRTRRALTRSYNRSAGRKKIKTYRYKSRRYKRRHLNLNMSGG